ncbi:MAG: shikimate dehydrogenase [Pseudoalteromonas tetraodonis]|jgi:shikimate dehydrogenase
MPEQPFYTLADLKDGKIDDLSPPAKLAVFGDPVEHSLSPQLHNPALKAAGIDAQYIRLHITEDEFPEALRTIRDLGFVGTNCTIPHKFNAIRAMNEVDDLASKLGAVNTVVFEDKKMIGFNSDGPGFVRAIREEFSVDLRDLRVLILGAGGGAGRAVATQCAVENCERLILVNRTADKATALKQQLEPYFAGDRLLGAHERLEVLPWDEHALAPQIGDIDLIVNATSRGMKRSDAALLPASLLAPHHLVYDMIYSPPKTRLLSDAASVGARTANGLSMLLHQGAISFECWFNREAPLQVMRKGLAEAL